MRATDASAAPRRPRPRTELFRAALCRADPRCGDSDRSRSPTIPATTAWRRSRARILAAAPPRFALAGLSMGGYIALTMLRQAPERVAKLALLDTSARPETPEQTERRKPQIALA